jgi:hypothetical protein
VLCHQLNRVLTHNNNVVKRVPSLPNARDDREVLVMSSNSASTLPSTASAVSWLPLAGVVEVVEVSESRRLLDAEL